MSDLGTEVKPDISTPRDDVHHTNLGHAKRAACLDPTTTYAPATAAGKWIGQKWAQITSGVFSLRSWNGASYDIWLNMADYFKRATDSVDLLDTAGANVSRNLYQGYNLPQNANAAFAVDQIIRQSGSNVQRFQTQFLRKAAGNTWQQTGFALQAVVDGAYCAAIRWNYANDFGLTLCTGAGSSAESSLPTLVLNDAGRVLGRGVTDDAVTGLQASSYRATNQPGISVSKSSQTVSATLSPLAFDAASTYIQYWTQSGTQLVATTAAAGRNIFGFSCQPLSGNTAASNLDIFLYKNGVAIAALAFNYQSNQCFNFQTLLNVAAGDFYQVYATCGASAPVNMAVNAYFQKIS